MNRNNCPPQGSINILDFVTPKQRKAWERGGVIDIKVALEKALAASTKTIFALTENTHHAKASEL